jgi:hypothetical protein
MDARIEWRDLSDLPNHEISNQGQIRNRISGNMLPLCKTNSGCVKTNLMENGIRYSNLVHRLVMRKFVGYSTLHVNHIDGDKNNNSLCKLEYVSQSENIRHGFQIGLYNRRGGNYPAARLNR